MIKDLEALKNNSEFVRHYTTGMSHLQQSGIFNVLRQLGGVSFGPANTIDQVALLGARSNGFQECIDTLFNFLELYIDTKQSNAEVRMDFGGLSYALEKGFLTEEEANAIRRGESININPTAERGSANSNAVPHKS